MEICINYEVFLFFRKDWEQSESRKWETSKQKDKDKTITIVVTYSRSAITRGANFPDVCFASIDCNQFLPTLAVDGITEDSTKEEIKAKILFELQENLTQIVGRFLRTTQERIPGKTIVDNRNIVLLLHGLPEEMQDFSIDSRLLHFTKEYRNASFLSSLPSLEVPSIVEAVSLSRLGQDIPDREETDNQIIFQKALEKGLEGLDSDSRLLLSSDDLAKLEKIKKESSEKKRQENIEDKLNALKLDGLTWSQVYKKLNLDRFGKKEISDLKYLYKNL